MAKAGARLPAPPPRPGARGGVSAEVVFCTDAHAIAEALCPRRGLLPDGLPSADEAHENRCGRSPLSGFGSRAGHRQTRTGALLLSLAQQEAGWLCHRAPGRYSRH